MKYYHSYIFILLFGLLPFFAGCSDDHEPNGELPDGARAVVVNLSIQNSPSKMPYERAYTQEDRDEDFGQSVQLNENKIETLDVFFVEQGTDNIVSHVPDTELKKEESGSGASLILSLTTIIPYINVATYEGKTFDFYVVANCPNRSDLNAITTLSALKQVIRETSSFNLVPNNAQDNFLMDGMVRFTVNWGSNMTYTVPDDLQLRRAASKIRLRLSPIKVLEGSVAYEAGDPQVKLVHYTDKTSLMQKAPMAISDWKNSEYRGFVDITLHNMSTGQDEAFKTTQIPFYAYENDWSGDLNNETYLIVKIPFRVGTGDWKDYYYRIPVNYLMELPGMTQEEKNGLHKLQRNHLYDILCDIDRLGSDREDAPLDLEAYIMIDDWNEPDVIDGSLKVSHYLEVKELYPLMPNINERKIQYYCDTDVEWEITKEHYEYYNTQGELVSNDNNPIKAKITKIEESGLKYLLVKSDIPKNFVPLEIFFTVKSKPKDETEPLTQKVHVTQYPPKYVIGQKSRGYKPNEGESGQDYADFRYHSSLGVMSTDPITGSTAPQKCDVLFKITTIVNAGEELIGDPFDSVKGQTKDDETSNRLISPEFIIASQHGMSNEMKQYKAEDEWPTYYPGWLQDSFGKGFGPYSTLYPHYYPYYYPYYQSGDNGGKQFVYNYYNSAVDLCKKYFEGEYGSDGYYMEGYVSKYLGGENYSTNTRWVKKNFKYKGHWRLPTLAELKYIESIQANENSAVKSLLWGSFYWSAEKKVAYKFSKKKPTEESAEEKHFADDNGRAFIRCVFDTYKTRENEISE